MATRCVYCGSVAFGKSCPYSPNGCHKHATDSKTCMYCGSPAYGSGCPFSPNKNHTHGQSKPGETGRCRYCGAPGYGSCSKSPSRTHEH